MSILWNGFSQTTTADRPAVRARKGNCRACAGVWAAILAYAAISVDARADCSQPMGEMLAVQGVVEVRSAHAAVWRPTVTSWLLCHGDEIRTGPSSRAQIAVTQDEGSGTESVVFIMGQLTIVQLPDSPQSWWVLVLRGVASFLARESQRFGVKTPFVNAKVEGTDFIVSHDERHSVVSVLEGRIRVEAAGELLAVRTGEGAQSIGGAAPERLIYVDRKDAVRWTLFAPPTVDLESVALAAGPSLAEAEKFLRRGELNNVLASLPAAHGTVAASVSTLRAGILLHTGRIDESGATLEAALETHPRHPELLALRAIVRVVNGDDDDAVLDATEAVRLAPRSPTAHVALSYVGQVTGNMAQATSEAELAVAHGPENEFAWMRLAELLMGTGELARAAQAAEYALALAPAHPRAIALTGLVYLARERTAAAMLRFRQGLENRPYEPLLRFGLGLALIKTGDVVAGRRELERAAALNPDDALFRAYLGKAYFAEGRDARAGKELEQSRMADPDDPTSWLYESIRLFGMNRVFEARDALEKSIALNDNRAIYRSRALLDDDRAVRTASLARIYSDIGYDETARFLASRSIADDPLEFSAYRFLADSFSGRPRFEAAQASALLTAQLLQPVVAVPVRPQRFDADLKLTQRATAPPFGYNEYTSVFDSNGFRVFASQSLGERGGSETDVNASVRADDVVVSVSHFGLGAHERRLNDDYDLSLNGLFAQWAVGDAVQLSLEARDRESEEGDRTAKFNRDEFSESLRIGKKVRLWRAGLHYAPSPDTSVVTALASIVRDTEAFEEPLPALFDERTGREDVWELQTAVISRAFGVGLTTGFHYDFGEERNTFTITDRLFDFTSFEQREDDTYALTTYLHADIPLQSWLKLHVGGSYESIKTFRAQTRKVNPKLGVRADLGSIGTVQFAYFSNLSKGALFAPTLEPAQIATFSQFLDEMRGSAIEQIGVRYDVSMDYGIRTGVSAYQRFVVSPFEYIGAGVFGEKVREQMLAAYAYIDIGHFAALRIAPSHEELRRLKTNLPFSPPYVSTSILPIEMTGFLNFAAAQPHFPLALKWDITVTLVDQQIERPPLSTLVADESSFVTLDFGMANRFPKRRGAIGIYVRNVTDKKFRFQDVNFQTDESVAPRFVQGRYIEIQAVINLERL